MLGLFCYSKFPLYPKLNTPWHDRVLGCHQWQKESFLLISSTRIHSSLNWMMPIEWPHCFMMVISLLPGMPILLFWALLTIITAVSYADRNKNHYYLHLSRCGILFIFNSESTILMKSPMPYKGGAGNHISHKSLSICFSLIFINARNTSFRKQKRMSEWSLLAGSRCRQTIGQTWGLKKLAS